MKNIVVIAAVLLTIICGYAVYNANQTASSSKEDLHYERFKRMETEEALQKAQKRINSLQGQLTKSESKLQDVEESLIAGKEENDLLRQRVKEVTRKAEFLEMKLHEVKRPISVK